MASTRQPDTTAVVRQPQPSSAQTTAGVISPPAATPVDITPSASARRRWNQFTIAVETLSIDERLEPIAISANTT